MEHESFYQGDSPLSSLGQTLGIFQGLIILCFAILELQV